MSKLGILFDLVRVVRVLGWIRGWRARRLLKAGGPMTARLEAALVVIAGLTRDELAQVVARIIPTLGPAQLSCVPGPWFCALTELAKSDPREAGRLASAAWAHLQAHRPESPAPLDAGFVPTEAVPTTQPSTGG